MKNLIEEIEKEMIEYGYEKEASFNAGLAVAINILTQYNIITAPKSIKLSEIVKRLNDCDKSNKFKAIIQVGETTVVENTEFKKEYFYIKNNKMFDLSDYMVRDEYKWLYALWIAGTEIIDDLKEMD